MKMKLKLLRQLLVSFLVLCSVAVLIGTIVNQHNHKFSKSRGTQCERGILALNAEDSHICCDSPSYRDTWVCGASFDKINPLFSGHIGAFLIPLIPLLLNSVDPEEWKGRFTKRLAVYILIILVRMVLLWYVPMKIQDLLQDTASARAVCWCENFVSKTKCLMLFDFSDHIVLNMVQYMLPCCLEVHYSLSQLQQHAQSYRAGDYLKVFSIGAASTIMLFNLRSILLTSMFFHTFAENFVGFAIAAVVVAAPLYSRVVSTFWVQTISAV